MIPNPSPAKHMKEVIKGETALCAFLVLCIQIVPMVHAPLVLFVYAIFVVHALPDLLDCALLTLFM